MFRFKFDQNRTKYEEFDFFKVRGEGGGGWEEGDLRFYILISIIIGIYENVIFQISAKSHH